MNLATLSVLYVELTIFQSDFSSMDLNGLHIEHNFGGRLDNLGINLDFSIICPGTAELQVEQREVIMGRLDPASSQPGLLNSKKIKLYPSWAAGVNKGRSRYGTHDLGKISLSFASILLNSAEQYL